MHAYSITNLLNGKRYIGISKDVGERWYRHRWTARTKATAPLHKAIRDDGIKSFAFEVVACAKCWDDLLELEVLLIEQHRTYWLLGRGYNMNYGGASNYGSIPSQEQREKQRVAMTGQKRTAEQRARMSASKIGKKYSAEARANMSAAKIGKPSGGLGRKASAIAIERQRAARLGKKLSPEAVAKLRAIKLTDARRAQISADLTGRPVSVETREKMRESSKGQVPWITGKTHSEATVRAMSERMIGNVLSDETRAKISVSLKGRVVGPRSEETKARIKAGTAHVDRKAVSEETRTKMRAARLAFLQRAAP